MTCAVGTLLKMIAEYSEKQITRVLTVIPEAYEDQKGMLRAQPHPHPGEVHQVAPRRRPSGGDLCPPGDRRKRTGEGRPRSPEDPGRLACRRHADRGRAEVLRGEEGRSDETRRTPSDRRPARRHQGFRRQAPGEPADRSDVAGRQAAN